MGISYANQPWFDLCERNHTKRIAQIYFTIFNLFIALPMGRQTKRKCYRPPKRASWTLELSLPQINLFKVVLKSLKLLMETRAGLPSHSMLRVPCRWPFRIWNNATQESVPRDPVTCSIEANRKLSRAHMSPARVAAATAAHKSVRFSLKKRGNGND